MTKMHHECPKYPKTLENGQNTSKTTIATPKNFKMTKILLKPKKKKSKILSKPLKMTKIPLNESKIHSIFKTLGVFWLVSSCFTHSRGFFLHFSHFSNVEVYILIILDVLGILAVYEVSRFDCSI